MRKKYQKKNTFSSYKEGGQTKQEWVSSKISLLIKEGKNQDQAIAQALSMAEEMFQQGGNFNYNKQGVKNLSSEDIKIVNQNPYFTLEEDFAKAWLSKESPVPVVQPRRPNYNQMPIIDITSDGQWTNRKVWRTQKPEWFVGKREPIEGQDFTIIPYSQWGAYQNSPEYLKYSNRDKRVVDEYKEGGELPQYQVAGTTTNLAWQMTPPENNIYPGIAPQNQNLFFKQQPTAQEWATQPAPVQKVTTQSAQPTTVKPPVVATPSNDVNQLANKAPETLTDEEKMQVLGNYNKLRKEGKYPYIAELDSPEKALGMSYPTQTPQEYAARLQGAMLTPEGETMASTATNTQPQTQAEKDFAKTVAAEAISKPQPFQFINPGGVSLETAANIFGQGLANKDAFGIVAGGSKLLTGLGRNILSPYASNVASNRVNARAAEDMRDSITRTGQSQTLTDQGWNEGLGYYQEGGEMSNENTQEQMLMQVAQAIQQGAAPEEVLQQLITNGLDEQTATQLIQMVMQELQAQAPNPVMQEGGTLEVLKGKRILDYKLNPSTGKYTVTYED